jgi:hypothetical protein
MFGWDNARRGDWCSFGYLAPPPREEEQRSVEPSLGVPKTRESRES